MTCIAEYRSGQGQNYRIPEILSELLRRPVAAIVGNSIVALKAKSMTSTVPIVFVTGYDPVKEGLTDSINRPGGNITGVTFLNNTLTAKQHRGSVSSSRQLCWEDSQGCQPWRPAGRAKPGGPAGDQSRGSQVAWADDIACSACPCRRGARIAVHPPQRRSTNVGCSRPRDLPQ
ncbi:ABC transporter substrate binding protein [Reyranella sp.]|uniref:ABC transporter substrate binding protein n=1 Tax=Reyranella sp. TaxID=1929291 RepID=UPI003D0A6895